MPKGQRGASGHYPQGKTRVAKTSTSRVKKKGGAKKAGSKAGLNPTRGSWM